MNTAPEYPVAYVVISIIENRRAEGGGGGGEPPDDDYPTEGQLFPLGRN